MVVEDQKDVFALEQCNQDSRINSIWLNDHQNVKIQCGTIQFKNESLQVVLFPCVFHFIFSFRFNSAQFQFTIKSFELRL